MTSRVAGAVLAGGRSRRMGRTKALTEVEGRPMASWVLDALADAGCSPVVLVGGDESELEPLGVQIVADRHPGEGPAGAVATALASEAGRSDVVMIAACDLPFLGAAGIRRVMSAAEGVVAVARSDRLEPMCSAWPVAALSDVEAAFASGVRSMHDLLDLIGFVEVSLDPAGLRNINRPGDLDR